VAGIEPLDRRVARLAEAIVARSPHEKRTIVAIAGPPGAGKSTLAEALTIALNGGFATERTVAVPMDGFHYDNGILDGRGLRARKGAPETFDADGFLALLRRLRLDDGDVAIPVFDRAADLSRASARIVGSGHRLLLVEGNYLLLDRPVWRDVARLFDFSVFLKPSLETIEARLVRRWLDHGLSEGAAIERARGNDLANARLILTESGTADLTFED
jgi:pantothenate kinase